jgi:hypothetical protein
MQAKMSHHNGTASLDLECGRCASDSGSGWKVDYFGVHTYVPTHTGCDSGNKTGSECVLGGLV